ncbi:MAG TPA: UV DNA damage repair endonuclease UvsE [Candidatus Atribacteria bacterium]|nr:UV DNA damage repair endonuclease UvsE [Candidatus Atribacteria bacterium]HPT79319.1 UV DNA damage repair endonuclease UvsE [Candidatus Atribacteria bacterium]
MKVRLGYVAIALGLPKVTSSSQVTFTNYQKLISEENRLNKLKSVAYSNIEDLKKILMYNIEKEIHFYRITSALIPLATHPEVNWDYAGIFDRDLKLAGDIVKESNMRVDTHPDQFNVINSMDEKVVENTERNLWFHVNLFKSMDYPEGKMVLHIGSSAGGKEAALERFIANFRRFPEEITKRIILENDDKVFTARDTLKLCQYLGVPMVLDVHHHLCNNDGADLDELIPEVFKTWDKEDLPPKVHISSPKDSPLDRKHADFIDGQQFVELVERCIPLNRDFDVMIEAKMKDLALFELAHTTRKLRSNWNWTDLSTLDI